MGIVLKVNMIAQLVITGFSFGDVPVFGYLYGRKNHEKLKQMLIFCQQFLSGLSIVLMVLIFVGAPSLIRVMMNQQVILDEGALMLRYQVITTWGAAVVLLLTCLFQSMGKVIPSFFLSISKQGLIFVDVLAVLVKCWDIRGY